MHLVNQRRAQILPNRGHAPSEADITALGGGGRLLQGSVNAVGDKTKLGASCHPERRPRVMRQHEDRRVIRRLLAPPTLPAVVRPRTSHRTEHVASKNPGADPGEALFRDSVVDARLSVVLSLHLPPPPRVRG